VVNGQALYASCSGCHGPTPATGAAKIQLGTSAVVIQNATANVAAMRGISLSTTQAADLAAFIAANVAGGGSVPTTTPTTTTPAPSNGVSNGQALYGMCSGCHGTPASGRSGIGKATSASAILNAIARVGAMRGMSLSSAQASEIAAYVSSQRGGVTTGFTGGDGEGGGGDGGGDGGGEGGGRGGFSREQAMMAGGCTLGRADQPTDPLWLLMLAGALGVLGLRRSAKA
jgi:mono/diheme cytochrome c family protein